MHTPQDVNTTCLARNILIACFAIELAFLALDYFVNFGRLTEIGALRRMFNLAREDGLASWFAVTQTLLIALTLWLIYIVVKSSGESRSKLYGWLVLALLFTYMAIDDGAQIHERLGTTFERMQEASGGSFDLFPSYTWQIFFLPVYGAVGLFAFGFLWLELRRKSLRAWLMLAMVFLALAVAFDFFEGLSEDHDWNVYARITEAVDFDSWTEARFEASSFDTLEHFSRAIEESLEMAANSILWFLFLRQLGALGGELHVRFRE